MSDSKKAARRRLTDLYLRGTELSLTDDDTDDPIIVWISKISPVQQKESADRASAARAGVLALKKLPSDAPELDRYYEQLKDMSDEDIAEILIASRLQELEISHESELSFEEEWSKNGYLNSLKEAWDAGANLKYADDPSDPEPKRIHDELERFANEVAERIAASKQELLDEIFEFTAEERMKRALDRFVDAEGDYLWLNEFRKWQLYFAVRDPENHKDLYFESRYEIDELDNRILLKLIESFNDISVEAIEGKD